MSKPSDIWPSGTTPSKIIDGWGDCTTCGQPTGSADLWQDTCPRCAELAALEREIGRAVIGQAIIDSTIQRLSEIAEFIDSVESESAGQLEQFLNNTCANHLALLITRWRELHAAGAKL